MPKKLPIELTSLIHHIQLNESNWWEKALSQLILYVIWLNNSVLLEEIQYHLKTQFSIEIPVSKLDLILNQLKESSTVILLTNNQYKISEGKLRQIDNQVKEAEDIDKQAKMFFDKLIKEKCPSLLVNDTWGKFNQNLLLPLIAELGAKTYELISGVENSLNNIESLELFLDSYPKETKASLREVIQGFLNPQNVAVRSYILRHLNAFFFVEAGSLKEETINNLLRITQGNHTLRLFLDTNIVFSMLGFHNNPSNEAVQSLIEIVKKLSGKLRLILYVTPITVDEIKRSLNVRKIELSKIRFTKNISEVVSNLKNLSGISQKFAHAQTDLKGLSPEEFFGPYLNNLISILKDIGVEPYNENKIRSYSMIPKVIDDINERLKYEQDTYGEKAKSYEKMSHDVSLWHFVHDLRPASLESPLEAKDWVVTIDGRLISFDKHKLNNHKFRLPVCVHPASLVQMLQFWIPRTTEFEQAVITSLQIPFIFQDFDSDAEKVSLSIIKTLSKYEEIEQLHPRTIGSIVLDDVLRQKIKEESNGKKHPELIKEVVVKENIRLQGELRNTSSAKNTLERLLNQEKVDKESLLTQMSGQVDSIQKELAEKKSNDEIRQERIALIKSEIKASCSKSGYKLSWALSIIIIICVMYISYLLSSLVLENWDKIEPYSFIISLIIAVIVPILGISTERVHGFRQSMETMFTEYLYKKRIKFIEEIE